MARSAHSSQPTREALIAAALDLFGEKGFEATSTREIAAAASANIGSIAYHFGGKAGLRRACAEHIVETIRTVVGARVAERAGDPGLTPETARQTLMAALDLFIAFMAADTKAETLARFMLRETEHPTEAFDLIYAGIIAPTHRHLCRLWSVACGRPEDDPETLLSVFALIGQVLYFRIGREVVRRRLTWDKVGPAETEKIARILKDNVQAIIDYRIKINREPTP